MNAKDKNLATAGIKMYNLEQNFFFKYEKMQTIVLSNRRSNSVVLASYVRTFYEKLKFQHFKYL